MAEGKTLLVERVHDYMNREARASDSEFNGRDPCLKAEPVCHERPIPSDANLIGFALVIERLGGLE